MATASPPPPADPLALPADGGPPQPPWHRRLPDALARRGLGPRLLALLGLGAALLAVFALLVGHTGLGALLGLLALLAGTVATAPRAAAPPDALARALGLLVDLLLVGAFLLAASFEGHDALVVLYLLLLLLFAGLPYLSALAPPPPPALWRRSDRLGVLLLGGLLGATLAAALVVLAVGILDAWHRAARLSGAGARPGTAAPDFLLPLLRPDGTLQPAVRWGSLLIAVLVLAVLPTAAGWRF